MNELAIYAHELVKEFKVGKQVIAAVNGLSFSVGRRVWLGANVVVLPGVTIGDDTTVAAGSVVTRSLPAGVLAAGVPATVRRDLEP